MDVGILDIGDSTDTQFTLPDRTDEAKFYVRNPTRDMCADLVEPITRLIGRRTRSRMTSSRRWWLDFRSSMTLKTLLSTGTRLEDPSRSVLEICTECLRTCHFLLPSG